MVDSPAINFTRIFDIISYQQKKYPQSKALSSMRDGSWLNYPIDQIQEAADNMSCWLLEQGLLKGERIAIIPKMGSPEWMIVDFGCQQVGLVLVPIHPTSTLSETEFIIKETEAKLCIVADMLLFSKLAPLKELIRLFHMPSATRSPGTK